MTTTATQVEHTQTQTDTRPLLLEVQDLKVEFTIRGGVVKAVDGLTFDIKRGQTMGIIGESGCGKSVTARAILRMIPKPGKITGGRILYYRRPRHPKPGEEDKVEVIDVTKLDPDGEVIRQIRGGEIAMIFQEPMSSLTPVHRRHAHQRSRDAASPAADQKAWRSDGGAHHGVSARHEGRGARDRDRDAAPRWHPKARAARG